MKNIIRVLGLVVLSGILTGCMSVASPTARPDSAVAEMASEAPLTTSLFPSDQAVLSDDAVARILGNKLELPARSRMATMQFGDGAWGQRYYGSFYWRDEEFVKFQQSQMDTLSETLLTSDHLAEVTPLPSLMTPKQASIPLLREAAVRMQANLLLVFRLHSETYTQYRAFARDKVKAYSTCELVLLDVRTGLVPFTRIVTREQADAKQSGDFDINDTMRRAEQTSATNALKQAADDLVGFLKTAPKKSI